MDNKKSIKKNGKFIIEPAMSKQIKYATKSKAERFHRTGSDWIESCY